jgi:hypothetical protein
MEKMTIEQQVFYTKDAASTLRQNGCNHHADAILQLLESFKFLQERNSELSWNTSPDRSGGQFSDQEISDSQNWI